MVVLLVSRLLVISGLYARALIWVAAKELKLGYHHG